MSYTKRKAGHLTSARLYYSVVGYLTNKQTE